MLRISINDPRHIQFFEHNGRYFMLGGVQDDGSKIKELWGYDPNSDEWSQLPLNIDLGYFLVIKSRGKIFLVATTIEAEQKWYEFNLDFSFSLMRTTQRIIMENAFSMTINDTGFIFSPLYNSVMEFDPNY